MSTTEKSTTSPTELLDSDVVEGTIIDDSVGTPTALERAKGFIKKHRGKLGIAAGAVFSMTMVVLLGKKAECSLDEWDEDDSDDIEDDSEPEV